MPGFTVAVSAQFGLSLNIVSNNSLQILVGVVNVLDLEEIILVDSAVGNVNVLMLESTLNAAFDVAMSVINAFLAKGFDLPDFLVDTSITLAANVTRFSTDFVAIESIDLISILQLANEIQLN